MINRKTVLALAEVIIKLFYEVKTSHLPYGRTDRTYFVRSNDLYEFLYQNNYDPWFCNLARDSGSSGSTFDYATRKLKDFILRLHTGESISAATPSWTWEQRLRLGQKLIYQLAEDVLNTFTNSQTDLKSLLSSLELDGYVYRSPHLLTPEKDVLDIREESGLINSLYDDLMLGNKEIAFKSLELSEEHYKTGKWEDSISNSRKFLECILLEVAIKYSSKIKGEPLNNSIASSPIRVREYLEKEGLIIKKEKDVLNSIYGLLSEVGSHPYMAQNDQARLLRQLALTSSQFILLRLQGAQKNYSQRNSVEAQ